MDFRVSAFQLLSSFNLFIANLLMAISDTKNGGTVPYKQLFSGLRSIHLCSRAIPQRGRERERVEHFLLNNLAAFL